jgi:hypothetical protein
MRIRLRDGLWLVIALLAHGLLFLIPMEQASVQESESQPLSVFLKHRESVNAVSVSVPDRRLSETIPQPVPPSRAAELRAEADTSNEDTRTVQPTRTAPRTITTARLVDSATRIEWNSAEPENFRNLGMPRLQAVPGERKGWLGEDNLFDGKMAPAETQVLDRWLAADGSHNVVVETPSGGTYCGRATSWDPMNPLFEPVMQYRPCGGGGKRTLNSPDPARVRAALIQTGRLSKNRAAAAAGREANRSR